MNNNENVGVIIVAAGKGSRMKSEKNKQFIEVDGKSIILHTLLKFVSFNQIKQIVLVINPAEEKEMREILHQVHEELMHKRCESIKIITVNGGQERYESVHNGIMALDQQIDIVLVHDGARPLVSEEVILRVILQLKNDLAVVPGVAVKDTYKMINENGFIETTLRRNLLYSIQTPQGFDKMTLIKAYEAGMNRKDEITDDSMMVERYTDVKVRLVEGDYENIKITTPEDVDLMRQIIARQNMK